MDKTAGAPIPDRSTRCAIAIMAKAPSAGRTKTRLSPLLSPEEAKDLGCCFLQDMTRNLASAAREVPLDAYIAFAPAGSEAAFGSIVEGGTGFVLADGNAPAPAGVEGFGRCLLQAARSLFEIGYGAAGLLNSDSPTLPTALLVRAARLLLEMEDKVVLGASSDGGYYLLGMTAPHANLFRNIDWSTEHVARQTRRRAGEIGLKLADLDTWYDVDDAASLRRLIEDIDGGSRMSADPSRFPAPATAAWLRRNRIRQRLAGGGESHAVSARESVLRAGSRT
ncbi:MAG TPA: TIGR04282 family arsenosugar biosynthesis glycosyltransferase [Dongiaceae bacterium]